MFFIYYEPVSPNLTHVPGEPATVHTHPTPVAVLAVGPTFQQMSPEENVPAVGAIELQVILCPPRWIVSPLAILPLVFSVIEI